MATKKVVVYIDTCEALHRQLCDCPHLDKDPSGFKCNHPKMVEMAVYDKKGRDIDDGDDLPIWCPLEDSKEPVTEE